MRSPPLPVLKAGLAPPEDVANGNYIEKELF